MDPDITRRYHGGNAESAEAHASVTPEQRGQQRARVYAYILRRDVIGATCDEAEAALSMSHQACSARFTELKRDGKITSLGDRRKTRSGRMAKVFCAEEIFPF